MMAVINREHKDRLFSFLFGEKGKKEWTLSLYNAVNDTHYTDPDSIEFTTIEDAVYMGMKNDLSFILCQVMNVYEQQSSYNPNMPVRQLMYAAKLYDKYQRIQTGMEIITLPSTSPANAAWSLERLCQRWEKLTGLGKSGQ